jgi:hypothetical protein
VQQLDGRSLRPGQTVTLTLTSQALSAKSGLRIVPSWARGVNPLFLGYRTRTGGDAGLDPVLSNRVHINSAPIRNTYDTSVSTWLAALAQPGDTWRNPATSLVVRLTARTAQAATITVCRRSATHSCEPPVARKRASG